VQLLSIVDGAVTRREPAELVDLLESVDGIVWLDLVAGEEGAHELLRDVFAFRPSAVQECEHPGLVPRVRRYDDHLFVEVHAPASGRDGVVDALALSQFVGPRYLVTVHERRADVDVEEATRDTATLLRRMERGGVPSQTPAELSYALVSAVAQRMEARVGDVSSRIVELERDVLGSQRRDPAYLETMFAARHELVTLQTMALHNRAIFERLKRLAGGTLPDGALPFIEDVVDQFARVQSLCLAERDFLQELLDLYQTRTSDSMNIAMERLALITAVTLPVTALASVYGMNTIVNLHTQPYQLAISLVVMVLLVVAMLWWTRRQGWW